MVESNLGLANIVAVRHRSWGVPLEDLFQESVIGLIRGCELFDPDRQVKIGTYVQWWCRAFVMRYIMKQKSSLQGVDGKISRAISAICRRANRSVEADELAVLLGRDVEEIQRALVNRQDHVSLDSMLRWENRDEFDQGGRLLEDGVAVRPDEVVIQEDRRVKLKVQVKKALSKLSPRDALIIRRRYMADDAEDDATLQELGKELSITRERVRQLEQRAMDKLRKLLKAA